MPSAESETTYTPVQRQMLLDVANASIDHGLAAGRPLAINLEEYDTELRASRACFVTLEIDHNLRGCIGCLEPHRPLIVDVAENAYAAAFSDPRFPPLTRRERGRLQIHISILSKPTPLPCCCEDDLMKQLKPENDGLILEEGRHRATFLPSVWSSLPTPQEFLTHLKLKAGLPPDYWSDTIRFMRYHAISVD